VAEPGVISEYLERLAKALDFDPALSRRVRREVEDHLREAVAADPTGDGREAERRAVVRFGDPHVIATHFAVVSLGKQARRVGFAAMVAIAVAFIAMKARLGWYALMECPTGPMGTLGEALVSIDRCAFWISVLLGTVGWIYIDRRRIPTTLTPEYGTQLHRFVLLSWATIAALMASVISDGVLTAIRLVAAPWSFDAMIPLASMLIELLCAGMLLVSIRDMTQRTASTGRAARTA